MRTLGRYVFREILSSALLGTFLATAVIFLQKAGSLFEILVRSSANWETVVYLFLLALPQVLPLTIPFGVLIGILIGLGRLASDGEIIAMRAAGVASRVVLFPVLTFAVVSTALAGWASIRLTPWAQRETYRVVNRLSASELSVDIQPRVFEEQFTNSNTILYVGDVRPAGNVAIWRNVFMADVTPPEQRSSGLRDKAEGPLVTVAREAIAVPDPQHSRIQLSLRDAWTHEMGKDFVANDTYSPRGEQALEVVPPGEKHGKPFAEMNTGELLRHTARSSGPDWVDARIELNRRLALPFACIMLALVGVPLGISSRKGGKSAGYVTGVFLAFFCYHLSFISLMKLATQRTLPVEVALWIPNAAFGVAGLILILRMERPGQRDLMARFNSAFAALWQRVRGLWRTEGEPRHRLIGRRLPLLPQLVDMYVLSNFLFYFVLLLASFVAMTQIYNFFELLGDIVAHKIPLAKVFTYLFFLAPMLIYDTLPISVLVAVLVTFGILTKNNEVTAFKACGVSLHRLALPILLTSMLFSGGLFAFDYYYVPEANMRQDALRNEIKGKPPQTYLRPDRKWIFGTGSRIYYYKFFDPGESVMAGVSVYELDPTSFQLVRHISADRAQWQPSLRAWVFQNGWVRDFHGMQAAKFSTFQATTFSELDEQPGWFLKEVKQDKQMNFVDLERYIQELRQSGFDTVKLKVQFYRKFSVPLFALIMAMLAVPFSFLIGNRGAMAGIGVSIGIAITYWGIGLLFEKIGDVNQLPATLAAWSPDALFALTGMYLLLRMRS